MFLLAFQPLHDEVGFLRHLLVYVLPLFVVFVDVFRLVERHAEVLLHKQVHTLPSVLHPARSIDARADLEYDVAHRERPSVESADVDDSLQSHVWVLVELFQSVVCQYPVLSRHGHDVCRNAHRTEVEQRYEPCKRNAVVLGESLHELESHSASAQMLEGVFVVGPLWVEDGGSRRHLVVRHMMVADDEVDADALGVLYFSYRLDSAVENDNQAYSCLPGVFDALAAHPISLVVAVGNVVVDIGVILLQEFVDQCHGRASVHIVVTIHHDTFLTSHGFVQAFHRLVHVLHEERVEQVAQLRMEELLGVILLYSAFSHYQRERRTDVRVLCQFIRIFLLFWCRWFVFPFKMHLYCFFLFPRGYALCLEKMPFRNGVSVSLRMT